MKYKFSFYITAIVACVTILQSSVYAETTIFIQNNQKRRKNETVIVPIEIHSGEEVDGFELSAYKDAASVSKYATEAMEWAVASKIITGKDNGTKLDPQGNASRAECAIIIQRFMEKYN